MDLNHAKVLDMLLVACDPEYQNTGAMSIIFENSIRHAIEDGIEHAETGPELEHNTNVQALWKTFDTINHKERVCWLKPIEK